MLAAAARMGAEMPVGIDDPPVDQVARSTNRTGEVGTRRRVHELLLAALEGPHKVHHDSRRLRPAPDLLPPRRSGTTRFASASACPPPSLIRRAAPSTTPDTVVARRRGEAFERLDGVIRQRDRATFHRQKRTRSHTSIDEIEPEVDVSLSASPARSSTFTTRLGRTVAAVSWLTDMFDGLAAAGTLALAGVTYHLGRVTTRSVQEAYRGIDESAHRVMPHGFTVGSKCVEEPMVGGDVDPHEIDAMTEWDLTQHGSKYLGLWAAVRMRNEGSITALLHLDLPDGVKPWNIKRWQRMDSGVVVGGVELERQNGDWLVLPPGSDEEIRFVWWQASDGWALATSEGTVPTTTVVATIQDATGGARDRCELTFGALVLCRRPSQDGWIVAPRDMRSVSAEPYPVVAEIGELKRTFPGEPAPRAWHALLSGRGRLATK